MLEGGDPQDYQYFDTLSFALKSNAELNMELDDKYVHYKAMIDKLAAENPKLHGSIMELHYLIEEKKLRKESWWSRRFGRDRN